MHTVAIICNDGSTRVITSDVSPKEIALCGKHLEGNNYSYSLMDEGIPTEIRKPKVKVSEVDKDFLTMAKREWKNFIRSKFPDLKHLPVETIWKRNLQVNEKFPCV